MSAHEFLTKVERPVTTLMSYPYYYGKESRVSIKLQQD